MFNMKTELLFVFLLFFLKHKVTYASMWPNQRYSEIDVYLQGFTFESSRVDTIFACYRKCEENTHCASININLEDMTCELKYSIKIKHPLKTAIQQNMIYMQVRDHSMPGLEPQNPIVSCKHLKQNNYHAKSGVYWMKFNEPSSAPFQVFCDMNTDGGGWTLVYSYTFTQYDAFDSGVNAVTPFPNWPVDKSSGTWVSESTTTPLSESSRSAMDFSLWKKIGNEFLVKPNITNWVACAEGTGSLVNWVAGSLNCRVVKAITSTCTTVAPNLFEVRSCGPGLMLNNITGNYMYFDGKTSNCRAIHDPCGTRSKASPLPNATNPGNAMYVR